MPSSDPDRSIEQALAVVGYQWALHPEQYATADPIDGLERLHELAAEFPLDHAPLAEVYPHVARLTALGLRVLAALGDPDEVDGLRGFEGFDLWRRSR
jgi:hypothetical protein